jgi:hypothetical protein
METALKTAKLIALGLIIFLGYKLIVLIGQSHQAVFDGKAQLTSSAPLSLDIALHHFEATILICLGILSLLFVLFSMWRFQSVESRLRRLTGPSHSEKNLSIRAEVSMSLPSVSNPLARP